MTRRVPVFLLLLWLNGVSAAGDSQVLASGTTRTVLLELFTSEGCSSCPPAEEALNRYVQDPRLWTHYIPVAWHVDYWDHLGWPDRFARPEHGQRQQRYAQLHGHRTVYTPALFVNGRNWSGWRYSAKPEGGEEPAGVLTVTVTGRSYEAVYGPIRDPSVPLRLNLAVLGMGLSTRIQAGENAGRAARHEFVALSQASQTSAAGRWRGSLPWPAATIGATRLALVAWVSHGDRPTPLQAVGGYLVGDRVTPR